MALNYKIYQSNRKGDTQGKFYARALHTGTVTIDDLATIMQNNCTLKRSDIRAVLIELIEVMTTQLQNSNRVKLEGLGTFKLGISTTGAATAKEFTAVKNIKGTHVLFQPEVKIDTNKTRTRALVTGVMLREADIYDIEKL